jgi:hypothetical protein
MTQIGNVPEIKAVKKQLDELKAKGLVKEWEVPYENILTRLTAAIFFLSPMEESNLEEIWSTFRDHKMFQYRINDDKKLSPMDWRVEFNKGFDL